MHPNDTLTVNPTHTALLIFLTYGIVDATKGLLGFKGNTTRVRGFVVIVALLIAFGNTFLAPDKTPHVSPSLVWNTLIYGLALAMAALGNHALGSLGGDSGEDGMVKAGNKGQTARAARTRLKSLKAADIEADAAPRIPSAHPRTNPDD